MSAVHFQERTRAVDWNQIDSIDLNQITGKNGIQILQDCLQNVVFCNLSTSECSTQQLQKIFRLVQYLAEYLMMSQVRLQTDIRDLQAKMESQEQELVSLREEMKGSKKLWKEEMTHFLSNQPQGSKLDHFKCEECGKVFLTKAFLEHHKANKHADINVNKIGTQQSSRMSNRISLDDRSPSQEFSSNNSYQLLKPPH